MGIGLLLNFLAMKDLLQLHLQIAAFSLVKT